MFRNLIERVRFSFFVFAIMSWWGSMVRDAKNAGWRGTPGFLIRLLIASPLTLVGMVFGELGGLIFGAGYWVDHKLGHTPWRCPGPQFRDRPED